MALPVPARTWIYSLNNRIVFVSLADTMQRYLHGVKTFLKANGFTVKGSSGAGAGGGAAMDAVDRWVLTTDVTPRGTSATTPQAWIVLTSSGSAIDILLAWWGSSDDFARLSFSPGGIYVLAGTATHQPTATDEVRNVTHDGNSLIATNASGDRIWNGWVSSDAKACRFMFARGGVWMPSLGFTGRAWGIEDFISTMEPPAYGAPLANPTWLFSFIGANTIPNANVDGRARVIVASIPFTVSVGFGVECWPSSASTASYPLQFSAEQPQLQNSLGYPILPLNIWSNTGSASGKLGNCIDQWMGRSSGDVAGDTYGTLQFINATGYVGTAGGGGVWPWDGVSTPVLL